MKKRKRRDCKCYFVTLCDLKYYENIRSDFLDFFGGVQEYCVSIERHHVNNRVHLHMYVEFKDLVSFDYVRDIFSWYEGTVNVQNVRSKRNVLKYITKEDEAPLFNCRESLLAFSYRAKAWARRTPSFSFRDPFVLEHFNKYRLLQELHKETVYSKKRMGLIFQKPSEWYVGWGMQVFNWFYDAFGNGKGCYRPTKALYLFGPPGYGKSYLVEELERVIGIQRVYMPIPGKYFMGDFRQRFYELVLFEEWHWESWKYNESQIKRVLENKSFSAEEKYGLRQMLRVDCPVAIVSNEAPYLPDAVLRRLVIVDAIERLENATKTLLPKDETDCTSTEVIEIPSEDDTEESRSEDELLQTEALRTSTPLQAEENV